MFLDHTRRSTVGRTPLDEWSARRRDLYLTTHDTHNRQISMPRWDSNPRSQQVSGRRPLTCWDLCCVVVCGLETSRMGAPYIYDISHLRVNICDLCCVVVCDLKTSRMGAPYIYTYDISHLRVNICDLCCVVMCDLETSRIGAPYIYDISHLRVNICECASPRYWSRRKIVWSSKPVYILGITNK